MGVPSTDVERCHERTIDRLNHLLRHACRCNTDLALHLENPCCVQACFWMKGCVDHYYMTFKLKNGGGKPTKECTPKPPKCCRMCGSVHNWCCYHAKYCREDGCPVLFCENMKKGIKAYKASVPLTIIEGITSPRDLPTQIAKSSDVQRAIQGHGYLSRAATVAQIYTAGDKRLREKGLNQRTLEDRHREILDYHLEQEQEQQEQQRRSTQATYSRNTQATYSRSTQATYSRSTQATYSNSTQATNSRRKEATCSGRPTPKVTAAANESWVRGKRLREREPKVRRFSAQGTRGKMSRTTGVLDQRNSDKGK